MTSNLPPGVNSSMIPGNRYEDKEWEDFMDWAWNKLVESNLGTNECERAILIGIASIKAEREYLRKEFDKEVKLAVLEAITSQQEANDELNKPKPIGNCSKCGTPVFTNEGFCGVCEPHKL